MIPNPKSPLDHPELGSTSCGICRCPVCRGQSCPQPKCGVDGGPPAAPGQGLTGTTTAGAPRPTSPKTHVCSARQGAVSCFGVGSIRRSWAESRPGSVLLSRPGHGRLGRPPPPAPPPSPAQTVHLHSCTCVGPPCSRHPGHTRQDDGVSWGWPASSRHSHRAQGGHRCLRGQILLTTTTHRGFPALRSNPTSWSGDCHPPWPS